MNYLAIDVGGTFTKYAIISDKCKIVIKDKIPTSLESLESFIDSLEKIYEELKGKFNIEGIALSMPGIIDSENGFMYTGGNLTFISNINIINILGKRCGIKVTVENDAKCAALAEVWNGSLKECNDAIVVICGTGVGGAIIREKKVVKGSHFMAGEFSYIITESNGEYNEENILANNSGINSLLEFVSEKTNIPVEELNGEKIFSMANCGDKLVIAGLRKYVRNLAIQINNYQFILDPEKIAIGGGISVQPLFIKMIREELEKINAIYPHKVITPKVDVCKYFNDANLIGAVYVHMNLNKNVVIGNEV